MVENGVVVPLSKGCSSVVRKDGAAPSSFCWDGRCSVSRTLLPRQSWLIWMRFLRTTTDTGERLTNPLEELHSKAKHSMDWIVVMVSLDDGAIATCVNDSFSFFSCLQKQHNRKSSSTQTKKQITMIRRKTCPPSQIGWRQRLLILTVLDMITSTNANEKQPSQQIIYLKRQTQQRKLYLLQDQNHLQTIE